MPGFQSTLKTRHCDFKKLENPLKPFVLYQCLYPLFFRFKEYLEPAPSYDYSKQYLHVTLARVLFVIFFQYVVFFVKDLLAWLVPDVPKSLQVKIKRENHVARLCLRKSEVQATQETPFDATTPPYQSCESLFSPENPTHC